MSQWEVFLAQSSDLTKIADITHEAQDKSLSLAYNRAGSFSFSLPLESFYANDLDLVENCVVLKKNGVIVWSGPLWTKEESFHASKIQVTAVGWLELLFKRILVANKNYSNTIGGDIAHDLLSDVNNDHDIWINEGTMTDDVLRTIEFEQFANVGESIIQLSDSESGFDLIVDPETRDLNIYKWDEFNVRTDVVFAFNFGPSNVKEFTRTSNADLMSNRVYVDGAGTTAIADDTASQNQSNLFEGYIGLSEISDSQVLGAIANAELAVNKDPRVSLNIVPAAEGNLEGNVPVLFEDYILGDEVYFYAKRHSHFIDNQAIRIFSIEINIDQNGNQLITNLGTTFQTGG